MKNFDEWNKNKKKIELRRYESEEIENIFEGDIFWAYLGLNIGKEIDGKSDYFSRPVYIYKKIDKITFLVIPLTTSEYYKDDWHLEIDLGKVKKSSLCFNQIKVLDFKRIKSLIFSVDDTIAEQIKLKMNDLYISKLPHTRWGSSRDSRSVEGAGALDNIIANQDDLSSNKLLRNYLDKIVSVENELNWWKKDFFESNTRSILPACIEVVESVPHESTNYNCFVYALYLESYFPILGWQGWEVQKKLDKYILKLITDKILIETKNPIHGDVVLYFTDESKISHAARYLENNFVISKWSWGPLIKNNLHDFPLSYGSNILFYKRLSDDSLSKLKNVLF